MKKLIYKEDHQMYYSDFVIFETDCKASIEKMEKISYEPLGAGRVSTSFPLFKELVESYGFVVNEIERIKEIPENNELEIIKGATGYY